MQIDILSLGFLSRAIAFALHVHTGQYRNCHGELNMLFMSFPVIAYVITKAKTRWRAWRQGR